MNPEAPVPAAAPIPEEAAPTVSMEERTQKLRAMFLDQGVTSMLRDGTGAGRNVDSQLAGKVMYEVSKNKKAVETLLKIDRSKFGSTEDIFGVDDDTFENLKPTEEQVEARLAELIQEAEAAKEDFD